MKKEYEQFFREGGYRLMRLLVIKSEMEGDIYGDDLDVVGLMRLQYGAYTEQEFKRMRTADEICRIYDIHALDSALRKLLQMLPYHRGKVVDLYFGRGVKRRESGTRFSRKTIENALESALQGIEQNCAYDYASEGLEAVRKIMSYLHAASSIGDDISDSLLMRAVSGMKLFRNSRQGILYGEALREFSEESGRNERYYYGHTGRDQLISDMFIRREAGGARTPTRLESKVQEGRSSILIDWMYEIYSIMAAMESYMPDKYERIMSFHWTRSEEKLSALFLEIAAMIAAVKDIENVDLRYSYLREYDL